MFKSTVIPLLLIIGITIAVFADEQPLVQTKNGLIRGSYRTSRNGLTFAAFEGVPYAMPPVSDYRFKDPVPKEPWAGIWDATNVYRCMQIDHEPSNSGLVEGTEDCLYLNLFTPHINNDKLMDVIVHFHSGAFMWGHGDLYGPNNIMDRNVVFINLNYRLGPLGFLSTEDDILPGNMGLKDQNMALKWIKENIEHFGGNPDSITITGLSAGGASVHYHFLSPLSKGLFHRGISFSGNALCNWAFVENPLEKTRKLGLLVGCDQQSTKDLVACLRQRSPKQIVQAVKKFQPWLYNPYSPFGPVIERSGSNTFLPDLPYNLLKDGKVADLPWITSVTSEEGLYPAADFVYSDDRLPQLNKNWFEYAPSIMHYDTTATEKQQREISQKMKDYYLKGQPITKTTFPELVQALGDRLFVVDAEKAAKLQAAANKSPVYFYRFSYRGDHSYSEVLSKTNNNYGVSHADDVMYVASPDPTWFAKYLKSTDDNRMSELFLDLWTSYAKTGKPNINNVKWTPVPMQGEDLIFLQISSPDDITVKKTKTLGHRQFWDALPINENNLIVKYKDELYIYMCKY